MKNCNCIYLILIPHSVSSVYWQTILLTKSGRSRKLLEQAVQFSHLAAVWAMVTSSSEARIKSVLGMHTLTSHSDKPHSTVSHCRAQQLSNSWADIAAFIQKAQLCTLSTDKMSNWSVAGIHNLFNSGTPKKYYTFFLSTLDFDLSNCNWWSNFSKIVFYILQSTVYCISLIGHIMIYCLC